METFYKIDLGISNYDPKIGYQGSGRVVTLSEFKEAESRLLEAGFIRFVTPGKEGEEWLPVYNNRGGPSASVWASFIWSAGTDHKICVFVVPITEFHSYSEAKGISCPTCGRPR